MRVGVGSVDGLGNHDRQPRYRPALGDRSGPRGFLGAEGTRRSLANHPGIVVETSQNQFLATTGTGVSREEYRGGRLTGLSHGAEKGGHFGALELPRSGLPGRLMVRKGFRTSNRFRSEEHTSELQSLRH